MRSVAEQLRQQGKDQPARLAEQAADRAERVGGYLKHADADTILGDLEDFGRRRPWAVIAGGLALGIAASRFLKASSSRRYEERWERRSLTAGSGTDVQASGTLRPGLANTADYPPPLTRTGDLGDPLDEPVIGERPLSRDYAPTPSTADQPRTGGVPPSAREIH